MNESDESDSTKDLDELRSLIYLIYDDLTDQDEAYRPSQRVSRPIFIRLLRWAENEYLAGRWPGYIPPPRQFRAKHEKKSSGSGSKRSG
jgi:hypothetical protein